MARASKQVALLRGLRVGRAEQGGPLRGLQMLRQHWESLQPCPPSSLKGIFSAALLPAMNYSPAPAPASVASGGKVVLPWRREL